MITCDIIGRLSCDCNQNSAHDIENWCGHLREHVEKSKDSDEIVHRVIGQNVNPVSVIVPVFPQFGLSLPVWISIRGNLYYITGKYQREFRNTEDEYNLGLWNPGEGRYSIRSVILDLIKTMAPISTRVSNSWDHKKFSDACTSPTHGFRSQRELMNFEFKDPETYTRQIWSLFFEKICTPCIDAALDNSSYLNDPDLNSKKSFSGSGFGGNKK